MAVLDFTTLFKDRGAIRGIDDLAKKFDKAGSSAISLEAATKKLATAEQKAADAAGAVRVAETRLDAVRKNAKATAAQRVAAEENLARAQRRLTTAQRDVTASTHKLRTAQASVAEQADQTSGKLRRATGGLRAFGSAGVSASGKLVGGFKMMGLGVAGVATGILAAAAAPVTFGLKTAAANEQATISFRVLLGSAERAGNFLKDLNRFAATTPFEFPQLQEAASSLIAVGVNANKIIPILKTVGNAAFGMGQGAEGVQRATFALQQMSSAGRITAEDLNQLVNAGLPLNMVLKAISMETGISVKKLIEMRDAGKLGKKELEGLMTALESGRGFEKFNGLMDEQSKSLNGMLSTLKDTFGQGMANALQGAIPFLKEGIKSLTRLLGNFFEWTQTHQEDMVNGFIEGGDAVFGIAKAFLYLNQVGLQAMGDLAFGLANVLDGVKWLAGPAAGGMRDSAKSLRDFARGAHIAGAGIQNELIPKIDKAHREWTKFGNDRRTEAALRDANTGVQRAVEKTTESLKKNGRTIGQNTEAGRDNRRALKDLADANRHYLQRLEATGAGTRKMEKATDNARSSFIETAKKMGATKREAEKLADKFGLVDRKINDLNNKTVKTKITFSAVGDKFKLHIPNSLSVVKEMGGAKPGPRGIGGPLTVSHSHGVGPESGGPVVHPKIAANRFLDPKKTGDRLQNLVARGLVKKVGTAIGKSDLGLTGPSGSVGAYSADMAGTIAALRRAGGRSFTTYPGHHPSMAKARDVTPHSWKIANTAKASRSVWYVIYQMRIASKNHGNTWRAYHPTNYRGDWQHRRHVHVGWYDGGGVMSSGGVAANASGQPERVLSPAQTKSFDQLVKVMDRAGGAAVTQHFHFPNYVGSRDELVRALVDAKRQGRLDVILR